MNVTKEDKVTEKSAKKMNLALSTVGNIIKQYKKYGDGTADLLRNGRPRKINERTSRWISRNMQINPFITRFEIKTDLEGAGINVSKDIYIYIYISFKITKKSVFTENQTCLRPIKVCRNL